MNFEIKTNLVTIYVLHILAVGRERVHTIITMLFSLSIKQI